MIRAELVELGRRLVSAPLDDERRWKLGDLAVTVVNEALNGEQLNKRERGTQATFVLQDLCYQLPDHRFPNQKLRLAVIRGAYEQAVKMPPDMRDPNQSFHAHERLRADYLDDDLRRKLIEQGMLEPDTSEPEVPLKVRQMVTKMEKMAEIPGVFDAWMSHMTNKARRGSMKQLRQDIAEARREQQKQKKMAADPDANFARLASTKGHIVSTRLTVKMAEHELRLSEPTLSLRLELSEAVHQTANALVDFDEVLRGTGSTPVKESGPAGELPPAS